MDKGGDNEQKEEREGENKSSVDTNFIFNLIKNSFSSVIMTQDEMKKVKPVMSNNGQSFRFVRGKHLRTNPFQEGENDVEGDARDLDMEEK